MTDRNTAAARAAWGDDVPDWIVILAEECDRAGQGAAARRLGISKTTVNEVVRRTYKAATDNVEQKVRGAFMGKSVKCPVLDEITVDLCLENQRRPFSAANPARVLLHRTCPTCPFNRSTRTSAPKPSATRQPTSSPRE